MPVFTFHSNAWGLTWAGVLLVLAMAPQGCAAPESAKFLVFPRANERETYFSLHRIREAHQTSRGKGARVGVLDHSFGLKAHPELYAGSIDFVGDQGDTGSHHGYWMALVVREIAPEAQIFALMAFPSDGATRARAMSQAIDWAIAQDLDVLTYSGPRFTPEERALLDGAVERAHQAGLVTTFLHYPHPGNILPTWLGPRTDDDEREPDLNVLQYNHDVAWVGAEQPFLSMSATAAVTAGVVALLRSIAPSLSPADCKRLLIENSRPMIHEGMASPRTLDAAAALRFIGGPPPEPGNGM